MSRTKTSGRLPSECDWHPYYVEPTGPLKWTQIFGNDHAVEVEIGSGKGLFLVTAAMQTPGRNFFGVEIARKFAQFAAGRLARHSLQNARIARADALVVFTEWLEAASVAAVHVYFPDPWWKRRHKKRRIFAEDLVMKIARVLTPNGELRIASDVEEYFNHMQALIAAHTTFRPIEPTLDPEQVSHITNFERKYRRIGKPIWRAAYYLSDATRSNPSR